MTQAEAAKVVAVLVAGFPHDAIEDETTRLWIIELKKLEAANAGQAAMQAALAIIHNGSRFPSWRDFRSVYLSELRRLAPPALEEGERQPIPTDAYTWLKRMTDGSILRDLEETTVMPMRPVWARWMRRQRFEPMLPPTDEEKSDAIAVMRDSWDGGSDWPLVAEALRREAERIFIEASA